MSDLDRRKEFEALAPWYAAGLLSPEETARMQAALAEDPVLRANIEAARDELDLVRLDNEAAGAPSARAWDRISAAVASNPHKAGLYERLRAACAAILARASASPVGAVAFATAATLVIVVQAGVLLGSRPGAEAPAYHTASESDDAARGPQLLIAFAPDVTIGRVTEILSAHHARLVDGPRAGGLYRIALIERPVSDADAAKAIAGLQSEAGVKFVLPAQPR